MKICPNKATTVRAETLTAAIKKYLAEAPALTAPQAVTVMVASAAEEMTQTVKLTAAAKTANGLPAVRTTANPAISVRPAVLTAQTGATTTAQISARVEEMTAAQTEMGGVTGETTETPVAAARMAAVMITETAAVLLPEAMTAQIPADRQAVQRMGKDLVK